MSTYIKSVNEDNIKKIILTDILEVSVENAGHLKYGQRVFNVKNVSLINKVASIKAIRISKPNVMIIWNIAEI